MKIPHSRRAIAPVLGTLIFLLVAIAAMIAFGAVVSKGVSYNQAALNAASVQNSKGKEFLEVSSVSSIVVPSNPPATPTCPPDSTNVVLVRNTGSVTANVTYTFGVDSSGNLWTCPTTPAEGAVPPGANETFYLPSYIQNGFDFSGVITSLGNTFYTNQASIGNEAGAPVVIGGSLFMSPGALSHFDVAENPLGDGYVLNGFAPWPTTGGSWLNLGSVAAGGNNQMFVIFGLTVKNLDTSRAVTLNQFSYVQMGGASWYLVNGLSQEASPYTAGVDYIPFDGSDPPSVGPGQTATLYFASPCPTPGVPYCYDQYQGVPGSGPLSAAPISVALFGTYSDGSIYSGSANLGVGYYTCLNPTPQEFGFGCSQFYRGTDYGVNVSCDGGTPCPVVAKAEHFGPFTFDISNFNSPPKAYILNQDGTVSDITDSSSMTDVSFTLPAGTTTGAHLVVITDGVNFVDIPVQVE